eukprot:jgi/Botrbrau1/6069/Bobra.177_1s0009.1
MRLHGGKKPFLDFLLPNGLPPPGLLSCLRLLASSHSTPLRPCALKLVKHQLHPAQPGEYHGALMAVDGSDCMEKTPELAAWPPVRCDKRDEASHGKIMANLRPCWDDLLQNGMSWGFSISCLHSHPPHVAHGGTKLVPWRLQPVPGHGGVSIRVDGLSVVLKPLLRYGGQGAFREKHTVVLGPGIASREEVCGEKKSVVKPQVALAEQADTVPPKEGEGAVTDLGGFELLSASWASASLEHRAQAALELSRAMQEALAQRRPRAVINAFDPDLAALVADTGTAAQLYSIFLRACASQGEAELALSAIHAMKLRGLRISGACHSAAISALCRADAVQDAVDYLRSVVQKHDSYEEEQGRGEHRMYNTIIGAALTSGRVDLGVELLNEMKQRNITWDAWTWRLMMEAAGMTGTQKDVAKVWREIRQTAPETVTGTTVAKYASALARCGRPDRALQVLRDYLLPPGTSGPQGLAGTPAGRDPNQALNDSLQLAEDDSHTQHEATPIRKREEGGAAEIGKASCAAEIELLSQSGKQTSQPSSGGEVHDGGLEDLPEGGGCEEGNQVRALQDAFRDIRRRAGRAGVHPVVALQLMQQLGLDKQRVRTPPSFDKAESEEQGLSHTHIQLEDVDAWQLAEAGDVQGVLHYLNNLPDASRSTEREQRLLALAAAADGDVEAAGQALQDLLAVGAPLTASFFALLFKAAARGDEAEKGGGSRPGGSGPRRMRAGSGKSRRGSRDLGREHLIAWLHIFQTAGLQHTPTSLRHLLRACGRVCLTGALKENLELAWAVFGQDEKGRNELRAALRALCRCGEHQAAFNLYSDLEANKVALLAADYAALIRACAYAGDPAMGHQVFWEMRQKGKAPTRHVFNALILAECIVENIPNALWLVDQMESSGLAPDEATWNTLLNAAGRLSRLDVASAVRARRNGTIRSWAEAMAPPADYTQADTAEHPNPAFAYSSEDEA